MTISKDSPQNRVLADVALKPCAGVVGLDVVGFPVAGVTRRFGKFDSLAFAACDKSRAAGNCAQPGEFQKTATVVTSSVLAFIFVSTSRRL